LLQNRHRNDTAFSALWSADAIQIFSTQRAIQALTFYSAYAAGKERAEHRSAGDGEAMGRVIVLRNSTGLPLILEATVEGDVARPAPEPTRPLPQPFHPQMPDAQAARNFENYCRLIDGNFKVGESGIDQKLGDLLNSLWDNGNEILDAVKAEKVRDAVMAGFILYALMRILQTPLTNDGKGRYEEIKLITAMAKHVVTHDDEGAMPS
jgi:hypothetical protein